MLCSLLLYYRLPIRQQQGGLHELHKADVLAMQGTGELCLTSVSCCMQLDYSLILWHPSTRVTFPSECIEQLQTVPIP